MLHRNNVGVQHQSYLMEEIEHGNDFAIAGRTHLAHHLECPDWSRCKPCCREWGKDESQWQEEEGAVRATNR